jgi:hypothetical protein
MLCGEVKPNYSPLICSKKVADPGGLSILSEFSRNEMNGSQQINEDSFRNWERLPIQNKTEVPDMCTMCALCRHKFPLPFTL